MPQNRFNFRQGRDYPNPVLPTQGPDSFEAEPGILDGNKNWQGVPQRTPTMRDLGNGPDSVGNPTFDTQRYTGGDDYGSHPGYPTEGMTMPQQYGSVTDSLPGFIANNPYVKGATTLWKLGGSIGNFLKSKYGGNGGGRGGGHGSQGAGGGRGGVPDGQGGRGGGGLGSFFHNTGNRAPIQEVSAPGGGSLYQGRAPYTDPVTGNTVVQSLAGSNPYGGRAGQPNMGGAGNFGDIPGGGMNGVGNIGSGEPGGSGGSLMAKLSGYKLGDSKAFLSDHPEVANFISSMKLNPYQQRYQAASQVGAVPLATAAANVAAARGSVMPQRLMGNGGAAITTHAARTQNK